MKQLSVAKVVNDNSLNSTGLEIFFSFLELVGKFTCYLSSKFSKATKYVANYYWQHKIRFLSDVVMAIIFVALIIAGNKIYQTSLEAQVTDRLVTKIDQHSSYKRNINRLVASSNQYEFMKVGGPDWLRQTGIKTMLVEATRANLSVIETAVLLTIADKESGFNPLAKAKDTTACGLNQFIAETGNRFGLQETECFNPAPNARAQIRHFQKIINLPAVKGALQHKSNEERLLYMFQEVYCRHHDGENTKACSSIATNMTGRSLSMLFGAYKALMEASNSTTNNSFAYAVYDTMEDMSYLVKNQITMHF